jgi:EpsD family peptidyl-prolyl cis-trans isomerase
LFAIVACTKVDEPKTTVNKQEKTVNVLAYVNKTEITEEQFQYALKRISGGAIMPENSEVNKKVLDSIISSRAMALLAGDSLSESERELIDIKVQAYREELLVKEYIDDNATPQAVSREMVEKYYTENPEEFGGESIKNFEYITSVGRMDDDQRKLLLDEFSKLSSKKNVDLNETVKYLKSLGFPVKYKMAELRLDLVEMPIQAMLTDVKPNQFAPIYDQPDHLVLLRVNSSRSIAAKPLAEVTADIRKKLAPIQLKKSIVGLVEKAKELVEITYPETAGE